MQSKIVRMVVGFVVCVSFVTLSQKVSAAGPRGGIMDKPSKPRGERPEDRIKKGPRGEKEMKEELEGPPTTNPDILRKSGAKVRQIEIITPSKFPAEDNVSDERVTEDRGALTTGDVLKGAKPIDVDRLDQRSHEAQKAMAEKSAKALEQVERSQSKTSGRRPPAKLSPGEQDKLDKDYKDKSSRTKKVEENTTQETVAKGKHKNLDDAVERLSKGHESGIKEGADFELSLRLLIWEAINTSSSEGQVRSMESVEATVNQFLSLAKEFLAQLPSDSSGNLAKEKFLTHALFRYVRNVDALPAQMEKMREYLKIQDRAKRIKVIEGWAFTNEAFSRAGLNAIHAGMNLAQAHQLAFKELVKLLLKNGMPHDEIKTMLEQCFRGANG
ncbi:MAG: hypothetical protein HY537_18575 [Deltaproteobacteria bacterium]|nr:hypothetical protein [Deltaproteobacteria bacterium]